MYLFLISYMTGGRSCEFLRFFFFRRRGMRWANRKREEILKHTGSRSFACKIQNLRSGMVEYYGN